MPGWYSNSCRLWHLSQLQENERGFNFQQDFLQLGCKTTLSCRLLCQFSCRLTRLLWDMNTRNLLPRRSGRRTVPRCTSLVGVFCLCDCGETDSSYGHVRGTRFGKETPEKRKREKCRDISELNTNNSHNPRT